MRSPVHLLSGVPQMHFVTAGDTEYFTFNVDRLDADVRVTATAILGDPDILISPGLTQNGQFPACHQSRNDLMRVCGNYTWMSSDFSSDEITVSHNTPCVPTTSSVIVASSCDPRRSFHQGSWYIGVYGYSGISQFSILAAYVGGHVTLVSGQPQDGMTSVANVCTIRNDDGVCANAQVSKQVAYFSFQVQPANFKNDMHVSISVTPACLLKNLPASPGCMGADAVSCEMCKCGGGLRVLMSEHFSSNTFHWFTNVFPISVETSSYLR